MPQLKLGHLLYEQSPPFGAKMYPDIYPRTVSPIAETCADRYPCIFSRQIKHCCPYWAAIIILPAVVSVNSMFVLTVDKLEASVIVLQSGVRHAGAVGEKSISYMYVT